MLQKEYTTFTLDVIYYFKCYTVNFLPCNIFLNMEITNDNC